jgi:hypothetical protein
MVIGTDLRWASLTNPGTAATNATASASIDLNNLGNPGQLILRVKTQAGTASNQSNKWTVLAFGASDTNTFSTSNTISGLVGTTNTTAAAGQFVLPANQSSTQGQDIVITVDKPGRYGRYFFVQYQPAANFNNFAIDAIGVNSVEAPSSASEVVANGTAFSI